jgi:hypothetical protein
VTPKITYAVISGAVTTEQSDYSAMWGFVNGVREQITVGQELIDGATIDDDYVSEEQHTETAEQIGPPVPIGNASSVVVCT